jgi:hypothetical protein
LAESGRNRQFQSGFIIIQDTWQKVLLPGVFVFSEEKPPLHSPVAVRNGSQA